MRYDAEHKAKTRARILKEAAVAIRSVGADRVSVGDIMARAGLTVGAFYGHFKSKDDLVAHAVKEMFDERYAAFLARSDDTDPRKALDEFVDAYLSARHCSAQDRGCPIPALAGDFPRLPVVAQKQFSRSVDALTSGVAALLDRLGIDDANARARSALAEMVGTVSMIRVGDGVDRNEALLVAARQSVRDKLGL